MPSSKGSSQPRDQTQVSRTAADSTVYKSAFCCPPDISPGASRSVGPQLSTSSLLPKVFSHLGQEWVPLLPICKGQKPEHRPGCCSLFTGRSAIASDPFLARPASLILPSPSLAGGFHCLARLLPSLGPCRTAAVSFQNASWILTVFCPNFH